MPKNGYLTSDEIAQLVKSASFESGISPLYLVRELLAMVGESERLDIATSVLQKDYYDDVNGVVEEIEKAIADGELTSDSDVYDRIHETIDGHSRVIYTHNARLGLAFCGNPEAYMDETGEEPENDSQQMFWAMREDVNDRLGDVEQLIEDAKEAREASEDNESEGE
jgi:hypothetical protein